MSRVPPPFDNVLEQLNRLLGESGLRGEVESNLRVLVQSALSRLDVTSREEFDTQVAALARARDQLTELETQVSELTAQMAALEDRRDRQ